MSNFISLHNHTDFSILDGLSSISELFKRAKELGQSSVAITDHGSLAGIWTALKESRKQDIKLIVGCELYFQDSINYNEQLRHIILLAKNAEGYRNLLTLNKLGFDNHYGLGKKIYPVIDWELLNRYSKGIICLTGCGNGIVSKLLMNKNFDAAESAILKLKEIFGDNLGLEVLANNMQRNSNLYCDEIDQRFINYNLINLGKKYSIKIVPTCNSHYVKKEDYEVQDVLLAIGAHQPVHSGFRIRYPVQDFYLKSYDEVMKFFSRNYGEEFAQELCDNSVYFADLCEVPDWIDPKYSNSSGKELPSFNVKVEKNYNEYLQWLDNQSDFIKSLNEDKSYLRYLCEINLRKLNLSGDKAQQYEDRLNEELDVLEYHDFSSYMLIVADYINWAKSNNISVGAGRGSVGGSLVGYLLNIHQADPIQYGLIFARFHNKEKSSFPDIDIDFASSGRSKIQEYLRQKYGLDYVAHVSNVNTITPKVYVRDIARACELGGTKEDAVKVGNSVADCLPLTVHNIDQALEEVPLFAEFCKIYPEFIKYKSICGKYRAFSTHAAGMIISKRPLVGLVPLRKDKEGILALEYDKEKAEDNGLVKMDILGLAMLDIVERTSKLINKNIEFDYDTYDSKVYDLVSSGNTFCVFQLGESSGTIDLCKRIKPKTIEDLANINALARPSSRDFRDDFINARNGKTKVKLLHPSLNRSFQNTYGFGLYEESLIYLAKDVANWGLHEADRFRKLTKEKGKNPEKINKLREDFIECSVKNGIEKEIVEKIWEHHVASFGGYGFNMSHAILYSMNGYQTAYLKAYYPVQFLLANLIEEVNSNALNAKEKIDKIKKELRSYNVQIFPPNINKSDLYDKLIDNNVLLTGLKQIKDMGDEAINDILQKRPFTSFLDFMSRVSSSKVRANNIQALAACGALDDFGLPRRVIYLYCSDYRKKLQLWSKKHDVDKEELKYPIDDVSEWTISELYALENYYLGESFICEPYKVYGNFFDKKHTLFSDLNEMQDRTNVQSMIGIIKDFFEFKVKKEDSKLYGQEMAKVSLEDMKGNIISCTIFPDAWKEVNKRLKFINSKLKFDKGLSLHFSGSVNYYEDNMGIIFNDLYNVCQFPSVPKDLKHKKISVREIKAKMKNGDSRVQYLVSKLENKLYAQGLLDLDDDI